MARYGVPIVNYADDFVVSCKRGAREALVEVRRIMEQLKLRVNEDKTRIHRIPDESVDFLGYTLGRCYSPRTGRSYIGTRASKKGIRQLGRAISEEMGRDRLRCDTTAMVASLNRKLVGWSNTRGIGCVSGCSANIKGRADRG